MKSIKNYIQSKVSEAVRTIFSLDISEDKVLINSTKREIEGDYTVIVFPLAKQLGKNPAELGETLGAHLRDNLVEVDDYNVVHGFLNLTISHQFWCDELDTMLGDNNFGHSPPTGRKVLIEYSSPNTNKPIHLGHIRNILLGWSCSKLRKACGFEVVRTQIVNDRGIAICKSMLAWKKFGFGEEPETSGRKGDHFVGKYYVEFEQKFQEEYRNWQTTEEADAIYQRQKDPEINDKEEFFKGFKNEYFNLHSHLGREAKDMLRKWESNDPQTIELWTKMNDWVYQGFEETYRRLGIHFDCSYYESDTYLLGKQIVEEGLANSLFFRKQDQSIWVDLSEAGLDEKIILRSDGTAVYLTQDLGTADLRYADHKTEEMIYVVGDEQNYHFQVLFEVMSKMGRDYAGGMHHLSYGMIELPEGKMKSREGTVVDADDFMDEVIGEARLSADERGELEGLTEQERDEIYRQIGMGALKYFIIKVNPQKRMIFNPRESVDMQGQTGPYVQNAYVRIQSVLRKSTEGGGKALRTYQAHTQELDMIREILEYPAVIQHSSSALDPSGLANYCFSVAKSFHRFYHDFRILNAESDEARIFRLKLCKAVAYVLRDGFELLGIEMPQKM